MFTPVFQIKWHAFYSLVEGPQIKVGNPHQIKITSAPLEGTQVRIAYSLVQNLLTRVKYPYWVYNIQKKHNPTPNRSKQECHKTLANNAHT